MPFAAILPAVIGAAGSIGGAALSSRAARRAQERAENSPLALAQRAQIEQQAQYGREAGDYARRLLPRYEQGVDSLSKYYLDLLGDDNTAALKAITPLVGARKDATRAALQTASYMPRGGGRGAELGRIYDSEQTDIWNLLASSRNDARANYSALIGDVGSRGQGLLGTAAGVAGSAANGYGSLVDRSLRAGEAARASTSQMTGQLGSALAPFLLQLLTGGGGGGGGLVPPPVRGGFDLSPIPGLTNLPIPFGAPDGN